MTPTETPTQSTLDSLKRPFDAAKFRPEFDRIGRWKNVKGGRKRKTPAPQPMTPAPAPQPAPAPTATPEPAPDLSDIQSAAFGPPATEPAPESKFAQVMGEHPYPAAPARMVENATAETVIGLIQTALVIIAEEEGILSDAQKTIIRAPLLRVLDKYEVGSDILPAEVDLVIALIAVFVEKLKEGRKLATWFAKVKAWAINTWFRRKGAQMGERIRNEVSPDLVAALEAELIQTRAKLAKATAQAPEERAA